MVVILDMNKLISLNRLCLWDTVWRTEEYRTSTEIRSVYTTQKKQMTLFTWMHHVALTQHSINSKYASVQSLCVQLPFFVVVSQKGKYLILHNVLLMPKAQSYLLSIYLNFCTQWLKLFPCCLSDPLLILFTSDLSRLRMQFSLRSNASDKTDLRIFNNLDLNQLLLNMRLYIRQWYF